MITDSMTGREIYPHTYCGRKFYLISELAWVFGINDTALREVFTRRADWPLPFYQKFKGEPLYAEDRVAKIIVETVKVLDTLGIERRSEEQDDTSDGAWIEMLLALIMRVPGRWLPSEMAARGKQTHDGNHVNNPALELPDPNPDLF